MKKRTKVVLIIVAVVIGLMVCGYVWYKGQVREDRKILNAYGQATMELWDKADECRVAGDYDGAYMYLDSAEVLRNQMKNELSWLEMTTESDEDFEYRQKVFRLLVQAEESYESGDELRAYQCLDAIDSLKANH